MRDFEIIETEMLLADLESIQKRLEKKKKKTLEGEQLKILESALEHINNNQNLDALINKPSGGRECKNYPSDGFIDGGEIPLDPWDSEYVYQSDGKDINIISYGEDGIEGGEEKDADIYLRKPQAQ